MIRVLFVCYGTTKKQNEYKITPRFTIWNRGVIYE